MGGNYFPFIWQNGCKHFIFWDKITPVGISFSDGELAWTSFNKANKKVTIRNNGNNVSYKKIHPTQKPPSLYKFCLENYATPSDKILDTHLGSGSIAIACHDYGYDLTACELDKDYFDKAIERIRNHQAQTKLF